MDAAFDLGNGHHFYWLDNGDLIWKHPTCKSYCEVDLTTGTHHRVVHGGRGDENNLTIEASLLCPMGCGTHGFIRNGKWQDA